MLHRTQLRKNTWCTLTGYSPGNMMMRNIGIWFDWNIGCSLIVRCMNGRDWSLGPWSIHLSRICKWFHSGSNCIPPSFWSTTHSFWSFCQECTMICIMCIKQYFHYLHISHTGTLSPGTICKSQLQDSNRYCKCYKPLQISIHCILQELNYIWDTCFHFCSTLSCMLCIRMDWSGRKFYSQGYRRGCISFWFDLV